MSDLLKDEIRQLLDEKGSVTFAQLEEACLSDFFGTSPIFRDEEATLFIWSCSDEAIDDLNQMLRDSEIAIRPCAIEAYDASEWRIDLPLATEHSFLKATKEAPMFLPTLITRGAK